MGSRDCTLGATRVAVPKTPVVTEVNAPTPNSDNQPKGKLARSHQDLRAESTNYPLTSPVFFLGKIKRESAIKERQTESHLFIAGRN